MLEISGKTNLLEQNAYKYSLQDVAEPNLQRDIYTQGMVPKVPFNHRRVPMNMPEEIWITDTSLRDGQQSVEPYTVDQIVNIYKYLSRLGGPYGIIRQTEFFIYSKKDREALEKCMELGLKFPEITTWIRATKEDFRLVRDLGIRETGILVSCSDYHIFKKMKLTRAQASAVMVRLLDPARRAPVDLSDNNPYRLADAPNGLQPFMIWARENGYMLNNNEPRGAFNKLFFGDENKTYFASAEEAAPYMRDVTVNVWQLQPDGTKTQAALKLTVHKYLAADVYEIFQRIFEDEEKFPIASVGGLRCTDTMRHAWGAAVDINPDTNCAADRVDGAVKITVGQGWWPLGTEKSEWAGTLAEPSPYSIAAGGSVVRAFAAYGWGWGGTWQSSRDFMHFSVRTDGG